MIDYFLIYKAYEIYLLSEQQIELLISYKISDYYYLRNVLDKLVR